MDKLIDIVKTKKDTYILTGDLNSSPDTYTISQLQKYLCHAGPQLSQKTWTTKPFAKNGFKEYKLNWRVDYMYVSEYINISKSSIIHTDVSDHLPILAEVKT